MFSNLPKRNFNFSVKFILLAANAFNLDRSKILFFGKELTFFFTHVYQIWNYDHSDKESKTSLSQENVATTVRPKERLMDD